MKKKKINTMYLVAKYLIENKKCYIHNMKKVCKANNVGHRILQLRKQGWIISTILEGYVNGIAVYYYKLVKKNKMPIAYI